jgi:ribonuclease HII
MEELFWAEGLNPVAGVDEVGRGPLAGPVVAAAVVIPDDKKLRRWLRAEARDSKTMTAAARRAVAEFINARCLVGVGEASVSEIDTVNIRQATLLAMGRALEKVTYVATVVDGLDVVPGLSCPQRALVDGDALELCVACASIVAKVWRDDLMRELHRDYPGYGWDSNAGYGTAAHLRALASLGVTPWHRRSFAPVKELLGAVA